MKITYLILITMFTFGNTSCQSQTKKKMENKNKNSDEPIHPTNESNFDIHPHLVKPSIGLTKREYFVAMALMGLNAAQYSDARGNAIEAIFQADEILKQLDHAN